MLDCSEVPSIFLCGWEQCVRRAFEGFVKIGHEVDSIAQAKR